MTDATGYRGHQAAVFERLNQKRTFVSATDELGTATRFATAREKRFQTIHSKNKASVQT